MILAFVVISTLLGLFMSIIWPGRHLLDALTKMAFIVYTICGFMIALGIYFPALTTGTIKLY